MTVTQFKGKEPSRGQPTPPDGEEPTAGSGSMAERVAKLESAIDGIRQGQNLMLVGIGLIVALMIYELTRIDSLPSEFRDMNRTLSSAITAAQGRPPQVILVPTPGPERPAQQ
jgi:hypothetical protein